MSNRDHDSLFTLPLAEFTAARNALLKRLKQEKRNDEAEKIRALSKPSVSAWAVNQLYWKHREEFDQLLDAGVRLQKTHALQLAGKTADLRAVMEARREAVAILLRRADQLLSEGGHSPTPDTMRRIQTTLETLSTNSAVSKTVQPGRLTEDMGPLGFESMVALAPNIEPARDDKEKSEAVLKAAEQTLRGAEQSLSKAKDVAEETLRRLRELLLESKRAENAVQEAEQAVENARTQLRQLKKT
jgi:hypothetical protein